MSTTQYKGDHWPMGRGLLQNAFLVSCWCLTTKRSEETCVALAIAVPPKLNNEEALSFSRPSGGLKSAHDNKARGGSIGTMLHPWPRDTGKCTAQGPNIMSPEAPMTPPEARRAELEGRGRRHGGRGRHNVARGRHIFQWHEARGVILTLLYRQADIDIGAYQQD